MTSWTVLLVDAAEQEIRDLPYDLQSRFLHIAAMLKEFGPQGLGMPHVRFLEQKLWEMRMSGRDGIARAIYFVADGRRMVVVRAFVKKSAKTPRREIDLALRRMKEFRDG
jgi:phage-related protein